ncbi:putative uncharacterized protein DDB_G0287113 [Megalops cyprinoides]|uniref:putative uncharacterized protein DDB_G0287113 n=1 Tax=Megalops cyprinoides TaxID=118141 RepID=UPI00186442BD|nr:putative uncharacterized protein DDB_G0287113 [Megalops cyprinoides]
MTTARHRKGKNHIKRDENSFIHEALESEPRNGNLYVLLFILFLMLIVGGAVVVWFCHQQQQTITQLTENLTSMQMKVVKFQTFQEEMRTNKDKLPIPEGFEERLYALEGAYAQAQKQVEKAVAITEQMKTSDLRVQVLSLDTEMKVRISELEQTTVSTEELEHLQEVIKSKSEEFQGVKERLADVVSTNTELTGSVEALSASFTSAEARVAEQASLVDDLTSQLEGQVSELLGLKETMALHKTQLETNFQELESIRGLLATEQARRTQNLGEQLSVVRQSLEDQKRDAQSLHSTLKAQLEAIQRELENEDEHPVLAEVHVEQPEEVEHEDQVELDPQEQQAEQEILEEPMNQDVQEEEVAQELQEEVLQEAHEEKVESEVQEDQAEMVQGEEVEQEVQEEQIALEVADNEVVEEINMLGEADFEQHEGKEDIYVDHSVEEKLEQDEGIITSEQE